MSDNYALLRISIRRYAVSDFASSGGGVYTLTAPNYVHTVTRGGTELTKVSSVSGNDEYSYNEDTKLLTIQVAAAPSSSNIVTYDFYQFFTSSASMKVSEIDPTNASSSDNTYAWTSHLLNIPKQTQSILKDIFGISKQTSSRLELEMLDSGLLTYLEDGDYSFRHQPLKFWYVKDGVTTSLPAMFTNQAITQNNRITISTLPLTIKFNQPAHFKGVTSSGYKYVNQFNNGTDLVGQDVGVSPIPFIVGDRLPFKLGRKDNILLNDYVLPLPDKNVPRIKITNEPSDGEQGATTYAGLAFNGNISSLGWRTPTKGTIDTVSFESERGTYTANMFLANVPGHVTVLNSSLSGVSTNDVIYFTSLGGSPGVSTNTNYYLKLVSTRPSGTTEFRYFDLYDAPYPDGNRLNISSDPTNSYTFKLYTRHGENNVSERSAQDFASSGYGQHNSLAYQVSLNYTAGNWSTHDFQAGDVFSFTINGGETRTAIVTHLKASAYQVKALWFHKFGDYQGAGGTNHGTFTVNAVTGPVIIAKSLTTGEVLYPINDFTTDLSLTFNEVSGKDTGLYDNTASGGGTDDFFGYPLRSQTYELYLYGRLTTSNESIHGNFLKYTCESAGVDVNSSSITTANTTLTSKCLTSYPLGDRDLPDYSRVIADILRSTGGYIYINDSDELVYKIHETVSTSGNTEISDNDIIGSINIEYNYDNIVTSLRFRNEALDSDSLVIAGSNTPYLTESSDRAVELHDIDTEITYNHILEEIDDAKDTIMGIMGYRQVTLTFTLPATSTYLALVIGQDITINSRYTNDTDVHCRIMELEKSIDLIKVKAQRLEGL